MTRLTKAIKIQIINKAVEKAGVPDRYESLREARADLANRIRIDALGGQNAISDMLATAARIKALDNDSMACRKSSFGLAKSDAMYCYLGGRPICLYFNGYMDRRRGEAVWRSPVPKERPTYPAGHRFCEEFTALENSYSELEGREVSIAAEVRAMLDQFTTIKKLVAAWPEVKELLPPENASAIVNLPAILVSDLNSLIGIPTKEKPL